MASIKCMNIFSPNSGSTGNCWHSAMVVKKATIPRKHIRHIFAVSVVISSSIMWKEFLASYWIIHSLYLRIYDERRTIPYDRYAVEVTQLIERPRKVSQRRYYVIDFSGKVLALDLFAGLKHVKLGFGNKKLDELSLTLFHNNLKWN